MFSCCLYPLFSLSRVDSGYTPCFLRAQAVKPSPTPPPSWDHDSRQVFCGGTSPPEPCLEAAPIRNPRPELCIVPPHCRTCREYAKYCLKFEAFTVNDLIELGEAAAVRFAGAKRGALCLARRPEKEGEAFQCALAVAS